MSKAPASHVIAKLKELQVAVALVKKTEALGQDKHKAGSAQKATTQKV